MTDATFTTTCARCAAPLEVTDATAEAVSKAHEERCFVPGDIAEWRLDGLTWERVTVVRAYPDDKFEIEHHRTVERWQVHRSKMRRVARQGQGVDHRDVKPDNVSEPLPCGPTLYDGMTAMQCYIKWADNRAIVERGGQPLYRLTEAQIEAGRRAYQQDALHEHAEDLRARLAASSERARLTVVNEQDCEDDPW